MVEMICGAYGTNGRLIRPADGPFSLSAEEEQRLVNRGVARYVREYMQPSLPVPPPGEPEESGGKPPDPEGRVESGGEVSTSESTPTAENKTFSREELDAMTKDSLLKIAAQLRLKANVRMNKDDILQVIHNALAQADEPDLPDLSPEGPVI